MDRLLSPTEATRTFLFTHTEHTVYMLYVFMDARGPGVGTSDDQQSVCSIYPLCVTPREKVGEPSALRAVGLAQSNLLIIAIAIAID